ncbi:MAG TPA: hypothetical protein VHY48_02855 [Acidobacteriaceae bacterium]|jgi:hypothetical protein|nr:hypothetical protein [Acidobacteriaceae bacterium]
MSAGEHEQERSVAAERLLTPQALLCLFLLVLCLLAVWPVAEVGITDDWSYIRTAQLFAHTGHFIYNGWATAILGWQVVWGALFAYLFGPTFTAIRLSMIPIDLGTALLYRAVLRRFGLNSSHATFGTLTLVLSPLFLPLASTFMSDVPGIFAIVLCLYLCQLALAAPSDRAAWGWLIAAALSNIVLGSVRQTAWLGVLVLVPSCGWLLRRRLVIPLTIVLWLAGLICIHLTLSWFLSHPYSVPEKIVIGPLDLLALERVLHQSFRVALTTGLLCLPVLATGLAALFPLRRSTALRGGAFVLLFAALVAILKHRGKANLLSPPWLGGTMNYDGLHKIFEFISPRANPAAGMVFFVFCFALCIWAFVESLLRRHIQPVALRTDIHWRAVSVLLLPFLLSYCLLLTPRSAFVDTFEHQVWDRYLLPIAAVLLVYLLAWHQERVSPRIPRIATFVLILFAWTGVATTHDLFAMERARVRLLQEVQRSGVSRTSIRGGFPFDAITQIDTWGYVNEPALINPPHAFHPVAVDSGPCAYFFGHFVPALHPRYAITDAPTSCLYPSPFPPIGYRTWFPPARRELYVGTILPRGEALPSAVN